MRSARQFYRLHPFPFPNALLSIWHANVVSAGSRGCLRFLFATQNHSIVYASRKRPTLPLDYSTLHCTPKRLQSRPPHGLTTQRLPCARNDGLNVIVFPSPTLRLAPSFPPCIHYPPMSTRRPIRFPPNAVASSSPLAASRCWRRSAARAGRSPPPRRRSRPQAR